MHDISLRKFQFIHICHNYGEALSLLNNQLPNPKNEKRIKWLNHQLKIAETSYVCQIDEQKFKNEKIFKDSLCENNFLNLETEYLSTLLDWMSQVLDTIETTSNFDGFWLKIVNEFSVKKLKLKYSDKDVVEIRIHGQHVESMQELKLVLVEEFENMLIKREKCLDEFMVLFEKEDKLKITGI